MLFLGFWDIVAIVIVSILVILFIIGIINGSITWEDILDGFFDD
jgi:hypothetical protein